MILRVPSRSDYSVELKVGTIISATITVTEKSILIEPTKSGTDYTLTEAVSVSGSLAAFPVAG